MEKQKPNRYRNHAITIRLSDEEYASVCQKIKESGRTQNEFLIGAALGVKFTTHEVQQSLQQSLHEICTLLAALTAQLRKIGVNINQLSKVANSTQQVPAVAILKDILNNITEIRKGADDTWQSLKSQMQKHGRTAH